MRQILLLNLLIIPVFLLAKPYTLEELIETGLKNNYEKKISNFDIKIAKLLHKQAKSALFPKVDFTVMGTRTDEDVTYEINDQINLPANMGGAAVPFNIKTPVLGRDNIVSSLNINYGLYTGGKISAIIEQAKLNTQIKKNNSVQKEMDVIYQIKKYYQSYILADRLYKNTLNSYQQMKGTKALTQTLFEGDSLKVKKTDYLKVKIILAMIESNLYKFESSKELAKSAIAHTIGLKWDAPINIIYSDKEKLVSLPTLNNLVKKAKSFNPNTQNMELLLSLDKEIIKEKSSAFYPSVGLNLKAQEIYNSQSTGLNTDENKQSWMIGLGIKIPLFDGFIDSSKLLEAKIKKQQNEVLKLKVNDAIAMQIKHALIEYDKSFKEVNLYKKNIQTAKENTELNFQGYQIDMIETSDVIQAQIMESFIKVGYAQALYNYNLSLATLEKLIGENIYTK